MTCRFPLDRGPRVPYYQPMPTATLTSMIDSIIPRLQGALATKNVAMLTEGDLEVMVTRTELTISYTDQVALDAWVQASGAQVARSFSQPADLEDGIPATHAVVIARAGRA